MGGVESIREIVNRAGFEIRLEGDSRKVPYAVFDPEGRKLVESLTLLNLLQFVEAETSGRSLFEVATTGEPGAQPSLGNSIAKDMKPSAKWRPRWDWVILTGVSILPGLAAVGIVYNR